MERDTNTRSFDVNHEGQSFLGETAFELDDETLAAVYGAGDAKDGFEKIFKETHFNELLEALTAAILKH